MNTKKENDIELIVKYLNLKIEKPFFGKVVLSFQNSILCNIQNQETANRDDILKFVDGKN